MEIIDNLKKRGFKPYFVKNGDEVVEILKQNIPQGETIGFGDSISVEELLLPQKLKAKGYKCNNPLQSTQSWDKLCADNKLTKYYVSSTNAITNDGILVNTDGTGNRISSMCFGPKKLFFVLGTNKICNDLEKAIQRIENVAAPLNAKRLNIQTPCVKSGKCMHCNSPETICKAMLLLYHPTSSMEVHVIIVDKKLGL